MPPLRPIFLPLATLVLFTTLPAHAALLQFTSVDHRDDIGTADPSADQTVETPTFGTTAVALPNTSATSTLTATPSTLTFTATHSRPDLPGYSWVHSLAAVTFTVTDDTPFTLTGRYSVDRAFSDDPTLVVASMFLTDLTAGQELTAYDTYADPQPRDPHTQTPVTLTLPPPTATTLLAGHTYFLFGEFFNESFAPPPGGTSAVADLTLALPNPAALPPAVAFALLTFPFHRRRRARI